MLIYYLVLSTVLFVLNFAGGVDINFLFFFLPAIVLLDYFIAVGFPGSAYSGKISGFISEASSILTFRKTFEECTNGKIIDSENLRNLEQVVVSLEERLRKPSEVQRRLYIFSMYASPLFPLAVMLSSILLQRRTDLYAGLFSYAASVIIVALGRRAFKTLERTITRLNNEIKKAAEDISYN